MFSPVLSKNLTVVFLMLNSSMWINEKQQKIIAKIANAELIL